MKVKILKNIDSEAGDIEYNKVERPKKRMPNNYVL